MYNSYIEVITGTIKDRDGTVRYYVGGLLHRENGPAIVWFDGVEDWYLHGTKIDCSSQEEFERMCKLKSFW